MNYHPGVLSWLRICKFALIGKVLKYIEWIGVET